MILHLFIKDKRKNSYKPRYNQVKPTSYKEYVCIGGNMNTTVRKLSIFAFVAIATSLLFASGPILKNQQVLAANSCGSGLGCGASNTTHGVHSTTHGGHSTTHGGSITRH